MISSASGAQGAPIQVGETVTWVDAEMIALAPSGKLTGTVLEINQVSGEPAYATVILAGPGGSPGADSTELEPGRVHVVNVDVLKLAVSDTLLTGSQQGAPPGE